VRFFLCFLPARVLYLTPSLRHLALPLTPPIYHLSSAPSPDGGFTGALQLSTKYYTARVNIIVAPPSAAADPSSWVGGAQLLPGADAVLLVADAGAPFDEGARALCSGWAGCAAAAGASTLLLVSAAAGLDAAGRGAAPGHAEAALEWALDSGFEHVCADPASPAAGGEGRDKGGIPRVLEALEATMWSTAKKAARAAGGGGARAAEEGGEAGGGGKGGSHSYEPPAFSGGGGGGDGGGDGGGALGALAAGAGAVATAAGLPAEPRGAREDDFEEILSLARATRDAARSGNLSDEQRREAAMATAMRLMAMLGVDDEEEEEEGEEAGGGGGEGGGAGDA
jgi:hypothetical protein